MKWLHDNLLMHYTMPSSGIINGGSAAEVEAALASGKPVNVFRRKLII